MELLTLILSIFPLSLAASVSPTILAISTVTLSDKAHPKRKLYSFLLGAAFVSVTFGLLEISAAGGLPVSSESVHTYYSSYIDLGLGLLLIFLGLKRIFQSKEKKKISVSENKAQATRRFLLFGIFSMATNFTTFAFYLIVLKTIDLGADDFPNRFLALIFINFFILLPITLPLFIYTRSPKRSRIILGKANNLFKKYGNIVTILLLLAFGLYFVIKSLGFLI